MAYQRIAWGRTVYVITCSRAPCTYNQNWHTDLLCRSCGKAIERVHPAHLVHIFLFLLITSISISVDEYVGGVLNIFWVLFLWAAIWIGFYNLKILRNESEGPLFFSLLVMTVSTAMFAFLMNERLQTIASPFPALLVLIGSIFVVLVVSFVLSCLAFRKANGLAVTKTLVIFTTLGGLDILILSFLFNLPFSVFERIRDVINSSMAELAKTLPSWVSDFVTMLSLFLEASIRIRFFLLVAYVVAILVVNAAVETFKMPAVLNNIFLHLQALALTFVRNVWKSLLPLLEIFWYINERVLAYAVLPWAIYFIIIGALYMLMDSVRTLVGTNTASLAGGLTVISLGAALAVLIPCFTLSICQFGRLSDLWGAFRNIFVADINLTVLIASFSGLCSLLLWALAVMLQATTRPFPLKEHVIVYSQLVFNHSFLIPIAIFLIMGVLYKLLKTLGII